MPTRNESVETETAMAKNWEAFFAAMSDSDLLSAQLTWGREGEDSENLEAWAAVNQEVFERGLE
jgi:hypothetical protein